MKISNKLTITFTIIVACILLIFSTSVYFFYVKHRRDDFKIRLKNRALNTTILLLEINEISPTLLRKIDDRTLTNMSDVTIIILDKDGKLMYSNIDGEKLEDAVRNRNLYSINNTKTRFWDKDYFISINYTFKKHEYTVLASAQDEYGQNELNKLIFIIQVVFVFSLLLVFFAGKLNSFQTLKPVKSLIREINGIGINNLQKRLTTGNNDELNELASQFNNLLDRIKKSVENERMFVSNASHELRNPITSIMGQIEVALIKTRDEDEYKNVLKSLHEDVRKMAVIVNGFLELAQSDLEAIQTKQENIRIDEILFEIKDDMQRLNQGYVVSVDFENLPVDEKQITVRGTARLLMIMLSNLIDNACKFSDDNVAYVKISFDATNLYISIKDNGIGIPKDELEKIEQPLYRARNATRKTGHGIGLSIVKKIAQIHDAKVDFASEENIGTVIKITFRQLGV